MTGERRGPHVLAPARSQHGYTLIELLVTVMVIGILAAIAIPTYVGIQSNALQSSAQSDLSNAKIAVIAYYTDRQAFPATIDSATLASYGYAGSSVSQASSGTPSIASFCLSAPGADGVVWYVTRSSAPTSTRPSGCV